MSGYGEEGIEGQNPNGQDGRIFPGRLYGTAPEKGMGIGAAADCLKANQQKTMDEGKHLESSYLGIGALSCGDRWYVSALTGNIIVHPCRQ
ncbi:hypothetical protein AALC25_09105 [Lachnospiraceae bacterium 29-84]